MVSSPENVVPERRVKLRIIRELGRIGEAYQKQITGSIASPGMESRKWMYRYFRELEEEGMIESRLEGRRKYYKLTQKGFNTLLDFYPKEAVRGFVKTVLEPIKFKENTSIKNIHFDFLIENKLGIRIFEVFGIPREIPSNISRNSDYVRRFLDPIRDAKQVGIMISERRATLKRLNNILLIYTGYRPSKVKKSYYDVLKNVDVNKPLQDSYKYMGVIEDTIKMIKKSPKNFGFVFARPDLEKVEEVIKELLEDIIKRKGWRKATPEVIDEMMKLKKEGLSYRKIAYMFKLSKTTVYNYLKKEEKVGLIKWRKRKLGMG